MENSMRFLKKLKIELPCDTEIPFLGFYLEKNMVWKDTCTPMFIEDTWSNRQIWPWSTKWSRTKANRVLPREHTGHSKHPLPKTQEMTLHMDIIKWSIQKSDYLYSLQPKMEKLYTVIKNKTVIKIMNSLLPNSDLNWRKSWKPLDHSGMT